MHKILIIDDKQDIRDLMSDILHDEGYSTCTASNSSECLAIIDSEQDISMAILDIWLEGSKLDGIDLLKEIRAKNHNFPILMISGHGNIELAVKAIKLGAYDFIEKPFKVEKLLITIKRCLAAKMLAEENKALKDQITEDAKYVGNSKITQSIIKSCDAIIKNNTRALITGQDGTGKGALARYIHNKSHKDGDFIQVNLHSVNNENFSETFKNLNIYTDNPKGCTLYLKNIDELPYTCHNILLNLLNDLCASIKVISSSTSDIQHLIAQDSFSKALYYRINTMPINLPPLKDRIDDIDELSKYFLNKLQINSTNKAEFSQEAISLLKTYSWPGNIRELKNVIERIFINRDKSKAIIDTDDIPSDLLCRTKNIDNDWFAKSLISDMKTARDLFESQYIKAQIQKFDGNISKAADFMGMNRSALHRKIKALNIED